MAQTEIPALQLEPSEEAEPRRKPPKIDEGVLASVPGDLQLLVMSDEEDEPAQPVQPIREEQTDPIPWFWCRRDLGTLLCPDQSPHGRLGSGGSLGQAVSPGLSWLGDYPGLVLNPAQPWSRGRPRGRSRGRESYREVSMCRFCGRGFKFRSALEMHMRSHTGERPYTCSFCGRGFSLKGNLKTHIKTHLNGLQPDMNQFILDQNRSPLLTLRQTSPLNPNQAPPQNPLQNPPLNPLQGPPLNPLQAPLQTCSWSQSLSRAETRTAGSKPLQCTVCNKTFSWRSTLSVHMRMHTGERPYSCTVCDKRFSLKGNLKDHMRRHLLDKGHMCAFCGLGFDHESLLLKHLAVHTAGEEGGSAQEASADKRSACQGKCHICPFCGLGFDHEQLYFSHLTVHNAGEDGMHEEQTAHGEEESMRTSTEDKHLICPFCGLQFEHKCLLFDHITVHTTGEETGEEGVRVNRGEHKESVHEDQGTEEEDDDDGEEEVFFAITVQ